MATPAIEFNYPLRLSNLWLRPDTSRLEKATSVSTEPKLPFFIVKWGVFGKLFCFLLHPFRIDSAKMLLVICAHASN